MPGQFQPRTQLQVTGVKNAFEQQNRATPAQGTDTLGFVEVQQGKAVGAAQGLKHPLDAVAVGVGLDHRPGFGIRRSCAAA